MRAAIFRGPRDIEVGERPDPVIREPTDAIVRVVLACVCGSDLWYYRGESPHAVGSIGHEFIGVVEQAGADVSAVSPGDLVVAPFIFSDMSCPHCQHGSTISCERGGNFGDGTIDGGQGQLAGPRGEGYRQMLELSPARRAGTPDEVATVGALLMGPDGAFITGSDFLMDGGVTASYFFGELAPN